MTFWQFFRTVNRPILRWELSILIFPVSIIGIVVSLVVVLRFVSLNPVGMIYDISLIYNFLRKITAAVVRLVVIIGLNLVVCLWTNVGLYLSIVNIFFLEGIGLSDPIDNFLVFVLKLLDSLFELLKLFCEI